MDVQQRGVLPIELIDSIIELLDDDKNALLALTLVCRNWLPLVQSRLLDRIWIQLPSESNNSERTPDHPLISRYIKHVALDLQLNPSQNVEEHEVESFINVADRAGTSDVLKSLAVRSHRRGEPLCPSQRTFEYLLSGRRFGNIIELNVWFDGEVLGDMIRFVCSFPQLQTLGGHFCSSWVVSVPHLMSPSTWVAPRLPASLKSLHLCPPFRSDRIVGYYDNWLSTQSPLPISELSVFNIKFLGFGAYVSLCSESLTTLNLSFRSSCRPPGPNNCDLSRFHRLESLAIADPNQDHHFHIIRQILSTISSPSFRNFSIVNLSSVELTLFGDQIKTLDDIIATESPPFKETAVLIHIITSDSNFLSLQETTRGLLPKCFAQGQLEVTQTLERRAGTKGLTETSARLDRLPVTIEGKIREYEVSKANFAGRVLRFGELLPKSLSITVLVLEDPLTGRVRASHSTFEQAEKAEKAFRQSQCRSNPTRGTGLKGATSGS
ncbi:hypothetical protein L218DRAFT_1081654 [Marasmius fiardii PR-910]|nr:hypothetical protein L218DRAFT_1081654 [Marasmius fiardii PR-910]